MYIFLTEKLFNEEHLLCITLDTPSQQNLPSICISLYIFFFFFKCAVVPKLKDKLHIFTSKLCFFSLRFYRFWMFKVKLCLVLIICLGISEWVLLLSSRTEFVSNTISTVKCSVPFSDPFFFVST